jgi:uncharacterized protein YbcI
MAIEARERPTGGPLAAEISKMMVELLAEYTGRGPTRARTTLGRDHVLVLLRDTLTKGERQLAQNGHAHAVLETRRLYQRVFKDRAVESIEDLTGRKVVGFMSDNHLDPDLGVEVFVFEPGEESAAEVTEGESG